MKTSIQLSLLNSPAASLAGLEPAVKAAMAAVVRQRFLKKAHAAQEIAEHASKQPQVPVNGLSGESPSLHGIPAHKQKQVEAKKYILIKLERLCGANAKLAPSVVMEEFVVLYRKRDAGMPDWVPKRGLRLMKPS